MTGSDPDLYNLSKSHLLSTHLVWIIPPSPGPDIPPDCNKWEIIPLVSTNNTITITRVTSYIIILPNTHIITWLQLNSTNIEMPFHSDPVNDFSFTLLIHFLVCVSYLIIPAPPTMTDLSTVSHLPTGELIHNSAPVRENSNETEAAKNRNVEW